MTLVNLHVHIPPNFSAFTDAEDAVATATREGVRALGVSSFFDQRVYRRFADACGASGVVPLFGLEFITVDADLAAAGVRVNDPGNPGRIYFCGKGVDPYCPLPERAAAIFRQIRIDNDARSARIVASLAEHLASQGVDTGLTAEAIAADVAERAGVPLEWVSLQERHIAGAFAAALAALPEASREEACQRILGRPAADAASLAGPVRGLLKAGGPAFAPEAPLSFADAHAYVLASRGIPTYPILADGARPPSEWEAPAGLAARLAGLGVYAAELIPLRNAAAVVDSYVAALTDAGLIVLAGTEHNTPDRIPLDPRCADGPLSDAARAACYEGACVVAAHQDLVARGCPGYVDEAGRPVGGAGHRADLVAHGAAIIEGRN